MSRRFLSICAILGLLLVPVFLLGPKPSALAAPRAAAGTGSPLPATASSTAIPGADFVGTPLSGTAPLAVQFTHTNPSILLSCKWTFGDGTSQSFAPGTSFSACPTVTHTYTTAGSFSVSLSVVKATNGFSNSTTKPNYIQVSDSGSPTAVSTNDLLPDLTITSINYIGSNPTCTNNPHDGVVVSNIGSGPAGTFVVSFGGQPQTVNGLASGQQITLIYSAMSNATATADSTQVIAESNENNNSLTAQLLFPTQAFTCTPTGGPSLTPTQTATRTPTASLTPGTGVCSPVTATITAPFTQDGAGTFCLKSSNLGTFINSWNQTRLTVNGVDFTNRYVFTSSLPAKIGGFWYVSYTASFPWSHFEAK